MNQENMLRKLEGLHTVETVAEALNIKKQSAINLLSRLKKAGYVTVSRHKRSQYKITMRKQRQRDPGMFDIINKYSPNMKLMPWYDHQVHGIYGPEEALIDAIQTKSFRAILASMRIFNHIKNWQKLYSLAKEKGIWQKVGALYDVAKRFFRVRRMPRRYNYGKFEKMMYLIRKYPTSEKDFYPITRKWKVAIPFRYGDIDKVITG